MTERRRDAADLPRGGRDAGGPPERVGAVVNPVSGDGRGREHLAAFRRRFPDATVQTRVTGSPAEVPAAARELAAESDLLAVVGGDGTVGEVADALAGRGAPPLFVVPAGRGNSAYRHFYGGADWRRVAERLADGVVARPADLGRVRADGLPRERFALGFSAGLFRRAVEAAANLRALPGPLAYLVGTARATLADDPRPVRVAADGKTVFDGPARLVAVGGGRYRGRSFELFPESRLADGDLHLLVVEPTSAREALRVARLARAGRHVEHPAVRYHRAPAFTLRAPTGLPVELDGHPVDAPVTAARLAADPGALTLAFPG